ANSVPDSGGVYFVPAFVGLGAPHWDMYARGAIFGLTAGAGRAHLARATLEAIAYQTRDVLEAMEADAERRVPALRVDGGGTANAFLMQFQADQLGIPVETSAVAETTARGAAFLAGLAVGFWPDLATLATMAAPRRRFEPPADKDAVNVGTAGRRVPLKCRLLDLGGIPVSNLTTGVVKVSSVNVDCGSLSGDSCAGDVYATGACGQTW